MTETDLVSETDYWLTALTTIKSALTDKSDRPMTDRVRGGLTSVAEIDQTLTALITQVVLSDYIDNDRPTDRRTDGQTDLLRDGRTISGRDGQTGTVA